MSSNIPFLQLSCPLYHLDAKNIFLHGDLLKEVYIEQPLGFVAQGVSIEAVFAS
jgi:hypothetical protein